ncbi:hypothetical protein Enr13x_61470 [Stieleria neptunia]|uniref:Uncharacterized protein n=1 Tax=Stieleria neptunia TaxID=2527979 RepID=A0A518HZF9_9BACT|nr:hypothetical protein [Stieleria neptunia]QDV46238.1 hypothetical protein Enr13x_61470 [Stieleria neptunia]
MTKLPTESAPEEVVQNDAANKSVLRKFLLFIIVMMLPIIGMLTYLNLRKEDRPAIERQREVQADRQVDQTTLP